MVDCLAPPDLKVVDVLGIEGRLTVRKIKPAAAV